MPQGFSSQFPPKTTRSHEVCGPGALFFAFALAGQKGGSVLWVGPAAQINPAGFAPYLDPKNLLFATAKDQQDILATGEEALRSGAVALVVMELGTPVGLTTGRRLQLAAEAGGATGLCIIPENTGSNAAETRWHCAPVFGAKDSTLQHWALIKNKSGTLIAWDVRWDAKARRIIVVSETAE